MEDWLSRTENLIGTEKLDKIKNSSAVIFGVGGVGSFVAEGLARSGIGKMILVDFDKISQTNINRQIHATTKTIGEYKVDVMEKRIKEINPMIDIETYKTFIQTRDDISFINNVSYIIDCVDNVTAKILIIEKAKEMNIPVISSMGTGNKIYPEKFEIADISKTSVCPLAKVMRKELKNRNIKNVKVLYSKEEPNKTKEAKEHGTISFVPSVAGLIISGEVIRDLIKNN